MLNCKDIARLVSESLDRRLSFGERLNLWMHISMCGTCRMFRRFQHRMHSMLRRMASPSDDEPGEQTVKLPRAARDRINSTIQSCLSDNPHSPHDRSQEEP